MPDTNTANPQVASIPTTTLPSGNKAPAWPTGNFDFADVENAWIAGGGSPAWAPTMAAIAFFESGGHTASLNNNPATGDYSVGLFQINYFNGNGPPRTKKYGTSSDLQASVYLQVKAAMDLLGNGKGISNWTGDPAGNLAINQGKPLTNDQAIKLINNTSYTNSKAQFTSVMFPGGLLDPFNYIPGLGGAYDPTQLIPDVGGAIHTASDLVDVASKIMQGIFTGFGIGWKGVGSIIIGGLLLIIGLVFIFHDSIGKEVSAVGKMAPIIAAA